jgi:hypothetical protein
MELARFTEAGLLAASSSAYEYFVASKYHMLFQLLAPQKMEPWRPGDEDLASISLIDIARPTVMGASGLSEANKYEAAYWDIFNQLFVESTRLMGDR